MNNYTKLFNSLLTSTIWAEDDKTRIVWVTMLAMADQHGEVHSTVPGLSRIAGVPIPDVETALAKFMSPDQYSRTKDHEGRRIAEIEGGWELLNHAKYRALASREDSKTKAADRQRRKRERDASRNVTPQSRENVTSHAAVTQELHIAEADTEAEAKGDLDIETRIAPSMPQACSKHKRFVPPSLGECIEYGKEIGLSEDDSIHFYDYYEANGWRTKTGKMRDWKASMRTWKRNGESFRRNPQPQLPTRYGTSTPSDALF